MGDGSVVLTFTGRGRERIISERGSQAWVLDARRARKCSYLVCSQNRHGGDWGEPEAPHGAGFLVGKIDDVSHSPEYPDGSRWIIKISEYAIIDIPGLWDGGRNPVRYTSLSELGIDAEELKFERIEASPVPPAHPKEGTSAVNPINIATAKLGLAAFYGVSAESIEIIIRG